MKEVWICQNICQDGSQAHNLGSAISIPDPTPASAVSNQGAGDLVNPTSGGIEHYTAFVPMG
jgi:hypothetical protein